MSSEQPSDGQRKPDSASETESAPASAQQDGKLPAPTHRSKSHPSPPNTGGGRHRGRRAASILCAVLSVLFLLIGVSGLWIMRTASNEDWTQRQIAATLRDPTVSQSLASELVTEFGKAVDVDAKITELLPPKMEGAAPILERAARSQLDQEVANLISSDAVVNLAASTVGKAQQGAIAVLSGDGEVEGVDLKSGEVSVNLLPLIPEVIKAGQGVGLFKNITIPDLAGKSRADQLSLLSKALDKKLPEDFAQPVVFHSAAIQNAGTTLDNVRRVLLWSRRLFWLLLIFSVVFAAGSLHFARDRARTAIWLGLGFVASLLGARLIVGRALAQLSSVTTNPGGTAAIRRVTDSAVSSLTGWYVVFGIVIVAALACVYIVTRRQHRAA